MIRTPAAPAVATLAAAASAGAVSFTSPSGNIDCMAYSDAGRPVADCLVQKAAWPNARARPSNCPLAWFPTEVTLERGRVGVGVCRGDIGPMCPPQGGSRCRVLRYGASVRVAGMRCTSTRAGVTCRLRNGAGRGFRVAREGYRRF